MFDVQKVKELGLANISLDGNTVYLGNTLIENEETKVNARIASLVYEEASLEFASLSQDKTPNISFDRIVEKIIRKYGLNGEVTNNPANAAINRILGYEHIEIPLIGNLNSSEYSILARTEKRRGEAVLKRCAQKRGFDITELTFGFDPKTRILYVDYKKIPFQKTNLPFGLTLQDKIQDAYRNLKKATQAGDGVMIRYYSDLLASYKNIPTTKKQNLIPAEAEILSSTTSEPRPALWQANKKEGSDYSYPATQDLKNLYNGMKRATEQNRSELAKEYSTAIKHTLAKYPISLTPEIWRGLNTKGKIEFYDLKILEAEIFGRHEALAHWNNAKKELMDTTKEL